ncbi:aspartate-semialdehyde dehydrogenase [Jeotgalibaca sp. MA1X17-3]|uniref:aspartate-semialdehyde dehydrogenase n=1 Tax=Jeotgalibaca sp. MA1X17-3 TaxID=2908211 RepID=UPI001F3DDF8B|nr:aspartate-semialdehyde dehydrogenase [Jeotgalibaca sp. MA1X17-3]UJF14960.1 aspartate-semialdehyde dehydrogenase [Jeotgalibaca sp. MA1X17-3]
MKRYKVAIVGASGAVGQKMIEFLEDSKIPVEELKLLASARSAGKEIIFQNQKIVIEETTENSFTGMDFVFFSAGGSITKKYASFAIKSGAIVIDNTSAYRMDEKTPLVVPEVNPGALAQNEGLIANPNCSTIQMVVALEPIRRQYGLSRIIVSTYQAVSGAGLQALEKLEQQLKSSVPVDPKEKHSMIAGNTIPQIDVFGEEGYTLEEWKMINETKKIMQMPELNISATCVRIPVKYGHSESIYVEVDQEGVSVADMKDVLRNAPGVILQDDPAQQDYPTALETEGKKGVFVGRVRKDPDHSRGFHMWVVSDNLVKGAAWNSIQIAETILEKNS